MIEEKTFHITKPKLHRMIEKEHIVSFKGTNIHCRVIGKGPSLVVLHGRFQNTCDYERLCRSLAHWFTVYGINHRGNGSNEVQGWITICDKTG